MTPNESKTSNQDPRSFSAWMASLPNESELDKITIPGSHESCATSTVPFAQCQTNSLQEQFDLGIRFLDIRCRVTDGSFAIYHGPIYQDKYFEGVLRDCQDFLLQHPTETILMRVKQEDSQESDQVFLDIFQNTYLDAGWESLFYLKSEIPRLGDVRGKVVLLADVASLPGIRYSSANIQDEYSTVGDDKSKAVKRQFSAALNRGTTDQFYINYLSATYPPLVGPGDVASQVTPSALDYLEDVLEGTVYPHGTDAGFGIVALDYVSEYAAPGLISALIQTTWASSFNAANVSLYQAKTQLLQAYNPGEPGSSSEVFSTTAGSSLGLEEQIFVSGVWAGSRSDFDHSIKTKIFVAPNHVFFFRWFQQFIEDDSSSSNDNLGYIDEYVSENGDNENGPWSQIWSTGGVTVDDVVQAQINICRIPRSI